MYLGAGDEFAGKKSPVCAAAEQTHGALGDGVRGDITDGAQIVIAVKSQLDFTGVHRLWSDRMREEHIICKTPAVRPSCHLLTEMHAALLRSFAHYAGILIIALNCLLPKQRCLHGMAMIKPCNDHVLDGMSRWLNAGGYVATRGF